MQLYQPPDGLASACMQTDFELCMFVGLDDACRAASLLCMQLPEYASVCGDECLNGLSIFYTHHQLKHVGLQR